MAQKIKVNSSKLRKIKFQHEDDLRKGTFEDLPYKCQAPHCTFTSFTKTDFEVHHLWPKELLAESEIYENYVNGYQNLYLLCKACHNKIHRYSRMYFGAKRKQKGGS